MAGGARSRRARGQEISFAVLHEDADPKRSRLADDPDPFDPADAVSDMAEVFKILGKQRSRRAAAQADQRSTASEDDASERDAAEDNALEDESDLAPGWRSWPVPPEAAGAVTDELKAKAYAAAKGVDWPVALLRRIAAQGWAAPTPVQQIAIPLATVTRRSMAIASETGSGKTAAFAIPCLLHMLARARGTGIDTLAIAPSHELATQVADVFKSLAENTKLRVALLVGGISVQKQIRLLRGKPDVVVATVGRLMALMFGDAQQNIEAQPALRDIGGSLRHVVVDEADRMLEFGKVRDVKTIIKRCQESRNEHGASHECQFIVASATLNTSASDVLRSLPVKTESWLTVDMLRSDLREQVARTAALKLPDGAIFAIARGAYMAKYASLWHLIQRLRRKPEPFKVLVFTNTVDFAQKIGAYAQLLFERVRTVTCSSEPDAGAGPGGFEPDSSMTKNERKMSYVPLSQLVERGPGAKAGADERPKKVSVPRLIERDEPHVDAVKVAILTARLRQQQRYKVFEMFKNPAKRCILIATDIAARGLDFPSVDMVIHAQVPRTVELLVHRSGRTARGSGSAGQVVFLVQDEEAEHFQKLMKKLDGGPPLADLGKSVASDSRAAKVCVIAERMEALTYRLTRDFKAQQTRAQMANDVDVYDSELEEDNRAAVAALAAQTAELKSLRDQLRGLLSQAASADDGGEA